MLIKNIKKHLKDFSIDTGKQNQCPCSVNKHLLEIYISKVNEDSSWIQGALSGGLTYNTAVSGGLWAEKNKILMGFSERRQLKPRMEMEWGAPRWTPTANHWKGKQARTRMQLSNRACLFVCDLLCFVGMQPRALSC